MVPDTERAKALLAYHDAVRRERSARDEVGKLLAALRKVHERKPRESSSTDHLVRDLPAVRELMEALETLQRTQNRCRDMALDISLVAPAEN